jgi:GNAT superfamily N-acetyltransferase
LIIVPLASHHDRKDFDCGEPSLNQYLQQQARQSAAKHISRTFVAVEDEKTPAILGYHTTLVTILEVTQVPTKISKSRIPALLLARLAVDQRFQGQGIGEFLLLDVLRRAVVISEQTGLHAVVLDALTDRAKDFYIRYGFTELLDDPYHLYVSIGTILKLGLA